MKVPAVRAHKQRVDALIEERNRLDAELRALKQRPDSLDELNRLNAELRAFKQQLAARAAMKPEDDWIEAKQRKESLTAQWRASSHTDRLVLPIPPAPGHLDTSVREWVLRQMQAEPYWFQKIEVLPGVFSPGWSDPSVEKLPYFGLPQDLTGKRVLDIGCAEGFFSFEAEKRGAREVIGIDSFPDSIRRFNIARAGRQSNATAFLMNVYDLEPRRLGTFDVVLFYGVFYHLKHPQYALERIRSVSTGEILFQTHTYDEPSIKGTPWARYHPYGMMSGSKNELYDPTVFWLFNHACCLAMLDHVGFTDLKIISQDPHPFVVHGRSPDRVAGAPPDQATAPWC
jgi:tRNA (mo5U34)-methyltransferase